MFTLDIAGLCSNPDAPHFDTYEDAKRCFDFAVDFIYRTHPSDSVEVKLLDDDDDPVIWSLVERDMSKDR